MIVLLRLLALSLALVRRGPAKFAMVVVLTSVCVLTFLTVEAFASASAHDLNSSVSSTLGENGEYRVDVGEPFTLTARSADALVLPTLRRFTRQPISLVDRLGTADLNCHPGDAVGMQQMFVLRGGSGIPTTVSSPQVRPWTMCLAGQDISRLAEWVPTSQQRVLGTGVVISAALEPSAQAATGSNTSRSYVLVTGAQVDETQQIHDAVVRAVTGAAHLSGLTTADAQGAISVQRVDAGELVRRAVSGVQLVYGLVAWAVLTIVGIGILIMELANVRERNWLFGLARAVGARKTDIALLVAADAMLVVTATALFVSLVLLVASPSVKNFGESTFQVPLDLVTTHSVGSLVVGVLALLLIGAAWPAHRAAQLDPVDILEHR